jgi:prevent-host-death family protein
MAIFMYMKSYSVAEARNHLPAIVHEAERGSPAQVTRRGEPVAIVLAAREYNRLAGRCPPLWKAIEGFRRRHDLTVLDAEGVFRGTRDRSPGRGGRW